MGQNYLSFTAILRLFKSHIENNKVTPSFYHIVLCGDHT